MRVFEENNQEYLHKCKTCKSIIAYKRTELKICYSNLIMDKYIKCPVCGERTYISIFDKKVEK